MKIFETKFMSEESFSNIPPLLVVIENIQDEIHEENQSNDLENLTLF